MKSVTVRFFLLVFYLVTIPGCGRLIDWGKDALYQGETLTIDTAVAKKNIKSVAVYDQFTTQAIFDALFLSDDVRTACANVYARKWGKDKDQYTAFLRRQLEENKHYISFYVLSLYEKPLGESTSEWALFLRIDDKDMVPFEVKSIDMPPEYELLFGKRFNQFKIAYSVKFSMRDGEDNLVVSLNTKQIALVFRSMDKEVVLAWNSGRETVGCVK
ncbi:MAG: hypothetical protein NT124_05330 [Candidatus Dependentiae bacterium]|nr:hypothetical protein [Candidatus Dependentiae bacterium]